MGKGRFPVRVFVGDKKVHWETWDSLTLLPYVGCLKFYLPQLLGHFVCNFVMLNVMLGHIPKVR